MKLKTFDGMEMYITDEQATKVAQAIAGGAKMIEISGSFFASGAIAKITKGGEPPRSEVVRLTARIDETYEQTEARQAKNREKLAEMRKSLLQKGVLKA